MIRALKSIAEAWLSPPSWIVDRDWPGPSQGFGPGRHTPLWQTLSWSLGDEHADRICKFIDIYVRVFNLRGRGWWR